MTDAIESNLPASVPAALVSLLEGLIDYAGLFPPASHDMAEMVRRYDAALASDLSWMLARVIVPVGELEAFARAAPLPTHDAAEPWCLSVLVSEAGSDALAADIQTLAAFNERHVQPEHGLALADAIELKASSASAIDAALDLIPDDLFPFLELPAEEDCRGLLAALAGSDAAAKIRVGGVTPQLNRPTHDVARFITHCVQGGIPFKATAGLHHPLPNDAPSIPAHQQGFLNVFTAAALAQHHEFDLAAVEAVLELADPEAFVVTDQSICIDGQPLSTEQIEETRASMAISFGACSFDEPVADLRALGLLPTG